MMPLKIFDEYLKEGTARKQSPDKLRSKALIAESDESYKILISGSLLSKPPHLCGG